MPDSEYSLMIELIKQFRTDVVSIEAERSKQLFKQASNDLQNIYNLHLKSPKTFAPVDHYLKNLYRSFNYSAVIRNQATKYKSVTAENVRLLDECIEAMINCCDVLIAKLKKTSK